MLRFVCFFTARNVRSGSEWIIINPTYYTARTEGIKSALSTNASRRALRDQICSYSRRSSWSEGIMSSCFLSGKTAVDLAKNIHTLLESDNLDIHLCRINMITLQPWQEFMVVYKQMLNPKNAENMHRWENLMKNVGVTVKQPSETQVGVLIATLSNVCRIILRSLYQHSMRCVIAVPAKKMSKQEKHHQVYTNIWVIVGMVCNQNKKLLKIFFKFNATN